MIRSGIEYFFMIILLPASILYKSLEDYPEIWTTFTPKPYMYYSSKIDLIPRKKQSDFDYCCDLAERLGTVIDESDESREQTYSESYNEKTK
jgi:hypothetical protein